MKKLLLIAVLSLSGIVATAQQLSVKKLDQTVINDGAVYYFNELEYPGSYFGFKIFNTSTSENMRVKAKVVSMTNATGSTLQLCIGDVCLNTITAGSSYPNNAVNIGPSGQNSDFDHLDSNFAGIDPALPVEYVIKIYQLDANNVEVGNSVTFTYRYSSVLATQGFNALSTAGIQIKSNMVHSELEIKSLKNVQVELFDMTGKRVDFQNLDSGEQAINVANLNAGVYIANFKNDAGQTASAKFVKK